MLIETLLELNPEQKKKFIRFATGSNRLPYGGLKELRPKLTMVKKTTHGYPAKDYLPSVMTC